MCLCQKSQFSPMNSFGRLGNDVRNGFPSTPFYNSDLSIQKEWNLKARYTAQFRADFLNFLNRANFVGVPTVVDPEKGLGFGCACDTPDAAASNPVLGSSEPRDIQFGLKVIF